MAVASCLAFAGAAFDASAAGLGKIVVLSSLGQPLRAEIELTASREELSDMRAQLASPDAFKQAGIDLAPALAGIRFTVDKRQNGQSVIRLSSDRPINDPFVDMLLELNWATGRLVREYTFLLDPPDMTAKASASSVVQPAARPLAPASPRPVLWVAPARLVRNLTQLHTSKTSVSALQVRDASCSYADFFLHELIGLWAGDEHEDIIAVANGDPRLGRTPRHIVDIEVRRQSDQS